MSHDKYFGSWDQKAAALVKEAEKEEEEEKQENDKACGLDPEAPKGPAQARSREMQEEQKAASKAKAEWIETVGKREVKLDNEDLKKDLDLSGKALKVQNAEGREYTLPAGANTVLKLTCEECKGCNFTVRDPLLTRTVEIWRCNDVTFDFGTVGAITADKEELVARRAVDTVQLDAVQNVLLRYADASQVGTIVHEAAEGLRIQIGDSEPIDVPGNEKQQQFTLLKDGELVTKAVERDERDFMVTDGSQTAGPNAGVARCDELKKMGNDAFAQSDFVQAAAFYQQAVELAPKEWAGMVPCYTNQAQCWLRLGHPDKAMVHCDEALKLQGDSVKALFRKGMAYHAMKEWPKAMENFVAAEKVEPKNEQIQQAIKMAGFKMREEAMKKN